MVIKTDYGELKSKYKYLGFGLWENRNPIERPPPPKKPSPPPPPPKAEPIWYNCTVTTESHNTSKELDDLEQGLDGYGNMAKRDVEVTISFYTKIFQSISPTNQVNLNFIIEITNY